MSRSNTDRAWKYFGKKNPYFGVITHNKYKAESLTDDARREFFSSGEIYIGNILNVVRDHLDQSYVPDRALDFGCGVGRLSIPLSKRCSYVCGVDVSESMIAEARKNCIEYGISNAEFVTNDDSLTQVRGDFNLVHSYIVFQHIPVRRGEKIVKKMTSLLQENGIGILHLTYHNTATLRSKLLVIAYKYLPLVLGIRNVLKGRPFGEEMMQMNEYNLNYIAKTLYESGCHKCHIRFTDHGFYGAIIFFQKKRLQNL
jgi:ubiquinone/menaquinone biosynthesis C-methylase UbiE